MVRPAHTLRLYPTELAAKKAALELSRFDGARTTTLLYRLLPRGENKATYLLSTTYRLTRAEQAWAEEHQAVVTKLGRTLAGGSYMPIQTNMIRRKNEAEGG